MICDFCKQDGLNWGLPPQVNEYGGVSHVGCLADFLRIRDEGRDDES